MNTSESPKVYLTVDQAAKVLGMTRGALNGRRARKVGPPYYKITGAVRYEQGEILEWMKRHSVRVAS